MNKTLMAALAASLAANVFLGGFVAGRLVGRDGPPLPDDRGSRHAFGMFRDIEGLSEEDRAAFRSVFERQRADMRDEWRAIGGARGAFNDALAAEPWDRAAAEQALEGVIEARGAQEAAFGAMMIDAFEDLSPEGRKALIKAHEGGRRRHHHGRGGRRPEGPPPVDGFADGPPSD